MNLPPATTAPTVTQECPRCGDRRIVPEGDRIPPCSCAALPPSQRENIDVYERISDTPGFAFFAMAMPMGERPVKAFAESSDAAIGKVKHLLDVGWKS